MKHVIEAFVAQVYAEQGESWPFMANRSSTWDPSKDWVYYSGPYWDQREVAAAVRSMVAGRWLSSGEQVARFEKRFGEKFGLAHNLMVNSGSSANLVMLAAVKKRFGWQDGDEIIVSACGFPTTVAPIVQNRLTPVFTDISWDDLNWDLDDVERKISPRTRAVLLSPVLGNPGDMSRLLELVARANIKLILDNCDSLGTTYLGRFLSDYTVASSCSFYPAHHLCTMEGGMVSSNDAEIITLARSFAWWGRDCHCSGVQNLMPCGMCGERFKAWLPGYDGIVDHKYVFANMGYNLKPLDLQGAIGLVQLDKWDEIHGGRRSNYQQIAEMLNKIPGVRVIGESNRCETSWFGVPIACDSADLKQRLVAHLEGHRVQTRNYFAGNILQHPGYSHLDDARQYPNCNLVLDRVFFLGCSPTLTQPMIDHINHTIDGFINA